MDRIEDVRHKLHEAEERLLDELRTLRRGFRQPEDGGGLPPIQLTLGQRVADTVAATMGSWTFIIIQSVILLFWIILNVTAYIRNGIPTPSFCSIWLCRSKQPMRRPSS